MGFVRSVFGNSLYAEAFGRLRRAGQRIDRFGFVPQPPAAEHRPLVGVLAAEVAVHGHTVLRTAAGEDLAAEIIGDPLVEKVAALAEASKTSLSSTSAHV